MEVTHSLPPTTPAAHPASTAGTKRKRETAVKYYAVHIGKAPGIYHTWSECLDQVRGWRKASFKSFSNQSEAQAFVDHGEVAKDSSAGNDPNQKYYGVRVGKVPGVYTSWPEVLEQITGWKGPKHRAFKTRAEAEVFVNEGIIMSMNGDGQGARQSIEEHGSGMLPMKKSGKKGRQYDGSPAVENGSYNLADYEPGEAPLPPGTEDTFDTSIKLSPTSGTLRYKTASELARTKYQVARPIPEAPIRIYTDGSALSNGQAAAIGGVGVYFGPKDRRNISEPLTGTKQTNQRAELTAIYRALEVSPRDRRVEICSDSSYSIKCVTEWFQNWRRNNWLNSSHKPVENRDLVQKIVDLLEERQRLNRHREVDDDHDDEVRQYWEHGAASVRFTWIKGHAKDEGNNAADELAVSGARVAQELGQDVELD